MLGRSAAINISTWCTGIGAALTAAGLYFHFRSALETPVATALRVSPILDAETTGLVVSGSLP